MALTAKQTQLILDSYVRSQGEQEPFIMLANLMSFVLTHTKEEIVTKTRQVVQEYKATSQATYDNFDTDAAISKAALQELIDELAALDAAILSE